MTPLVQAHHAIDVLLLRQGHLAIRAVETIAQQDVAGVQCVPQGPQQGVLAGLLARIRPHCHRILAAGQGRMDLVLCGDDFGSQRGLLISARSFDRLFAPKKKELFDLVHAFQAKVSHHCCGSSRRLLPRFIECGMDALQTVQPQAAGMNPYELKARFAGQITLHGAVDVQGCPKLLANGSTQRPAG